jgi:serine/threonine-protein kinase
MAVLAGAPGCSGGDDAAAPASTTVASSPDETVTGSYVGTLEGSDAYVAIVVADDGEALAFVTDGGESVDWLDGTVDGTGARLANDGGAHLDLAFIAGTTSGDAARPAVLSGTFTRPDSDPLRFAAGAADEPAGMYRAAQVFADGEYVAGWVVLEDGSQMGAVRRYETPLSPGAVDDPVLDLDEPDALSLEVPGGVLHPIYVDPARL